jgi:predicted GH43/DUF377 family glycosyl hydrolase
MDIQSLLQRVRTPNKYPHLILAPSYKLGQYDSHAIDCPFVFSNAGRFYMTHVGWDGIGYRTALASSGDLIHWRKEGLILDRGPQGSTTEFNVALTWIVRDNDLFGRGELKQVNGRYLGTYHAYPAPGYEAGSAAIGLCWSDDLRHWQLEEPCLHCDDPDAGAWERGGLYKASIVEHAGTFYMFYNAKNNLNWPWFEQTGCATSADLKHWTRRTESPLLKVGPPGAFDDLFASDPGVYKVGDAWALFYFGNCSDGHARDSVAFSPDLIHWEKSNEVLLDIGASGSIDSRHAHKPSMFFHAGKLYHYYCAVAPASDPHLGEIEHDELRGLSVCTS